MADIYNKSSLAKSGDGCTVRKTLYERNVLQNKCIFATFFYKVALNPPTCASDLSSISPIIYIVLKLFFAII